MQPRPLTYCADLVASILQTLAAGECCSIVGINGIGKTNLIQHLIRPEVAAHHLGSDPTGLRFIWLDANLFIAWDSWGFYEGVAEALRAAPWPAEQRQALTTIHATILAHPNDRGVALRSCADMLATLCATYRLVLLFDEFDPLFGVLDGQIIRNLRALRDRHKYRLMYVTLTRHQLTYLPAAADWDVVEPFVELLSLHQFGLHPLKPVDSTFDVNRFARRHGLPDPDPGLREQMIYLSGGHPALTRALTHLFLVRGEPQFSVQTLLTVPSIELECRKIWMQLSDDEQEGLIRLASGKPINTLNSADLRLKGLINSDGMIFSPLIVGYIGTIGQERGTAAAIDIDPDARRFIYYQKPIEQHLSKLEQDLLIYLWRQLGRICAFDDVAEAVYPAERNFDLTRLRSLTRRLRQKLERIEPDRPCLLRIYPGVGYRLLATTQDIP